MTRRDCGSRGAASPGMAQRPSSPVAIVRPSDLIVYALAGAGHPVVPIRPNAVKASRPRYRAARGKDDRSDGYLLADLPRTDGHRFRPLAPVSDGTRSLRALVRGRDDLVAARVGPANQLRALLEGFWPGAAIVFAEVDSPIAPALLRTHPTPETAARLGCKRLASFLAQHRHCGRRSPEALLARLRSAPTGLAGEAEAEAKGEMVRALVAVLARLVAGITELTARIRHAVAELPDGPIVMRFPRAGRICAAAILAEIGDDRACYPSADQLAADAGLAPVTHQSGKRRGVSFRQACNRRLRAALTCFADNARHTSPRAAAVHARAGLRVIWRAWVDRTPDDPGKYASAAAMG